MPSGRGEPIDALLTPSDGPCLALTVVGVFIMTYVVFVALNSGIHGVEGQISWLCRRDGADGDSIYSPPLSMPQSRQRRFWDGDGVFVVGPRPSSFGGTLRVSHL